MRLTPCAPDLDDETERLVRAIRARRSGSLLNLDRMLLHSPPLADGWNTFLGTVRKTLSLSPKLRELAICAIAVLNDAAYEFEQHAPEFLQAGGTMEQQAALMQFGKADFENGLFNREEQAVLQLTLEMTCNVKVEDATFCTTRSVLMSDQEMIELVGVIAAYNMVSRFLVALEIDPEKA